MAVNPIALDSSGHARHATPIGTGQLWKQPGPYGGGDRNWGVQFPNFAGNFAQNTTYNDSSSGAYTLSTWVYADTRGQVGGSGAFYFFTQTSNAGNTAFPWGFYFGGLNPGHGWTNPQDLATESGFFVVNVITAFMPMNSWNHFAVRSNAATGNHDVFLNGVLNTSNVPTNNMNSGILNIGSGFYGLLAGYGVFDQALSDARIAAHYSASTSNAAYRAALLSDAPTGLWMLDVTNNGWYLDQVAMSG